MPEEESELLGAIDETDPGFGVVSPLDRIIYWAPVAVFGASLLFLLATVIANPGSDKKMPDPPEAYYARAWEALSAVREPGADLNAESRRRLLTTARVNLKRMIYHYASQLDDPAGLLKPGALERYVNPYLLLGVTDALLEEVSVPERGEELLHEARASFGRALSYEEANREGAEEEAWRAQFRLGAAAGEARDEEEVRLRRERRTRFIRYHLGEIALRSGEPEEALGNFDELERIYSGEEIGRLRAGFEGQSYLDPGRRYRYIDYELLPEDKVRLQYLLAQAYDALGRREEAERAYRLFLLQAGRSRERFRAQVRLGRIEYERGRQRRDEAERLLGPERQEALREAQRRFRNAAEAATRVVNASPPEDLLRQAYFFGGLARLAAADVMNVGRATTWDGVARVAEGVQQMLERYSGAKLPGRTLALPSALGSALLRDAAGFDAGPAGALRLALGGSLALASQPRTTPRDERDALLAQSRSYFDAASGGEDESLLEASRVMIGQSLLVEGRTEEARNILLHAMSSYPSPVVRAGALIGMGESYLQEGLLEEAWDHLRRLPGRAGLPASELVDGNRIARDLRQLSRLYLQEAEALRIPPEWDASSRGSPHWLEIVKLAKARRDALERGAHVCERLQAAYRPDDPDLALALAELYIRRAELLRLPPYGGAKEREQARVLTIQAADIHWRTALETPDSVFSEEALERAGQLFFSVGAFERTAESLLLFLERHSASQRAGRMRNLLGLAYRRLGMYEDAADVFRLNSEDSTTAEGRKALHHLGETYMLWGSEHLGGPEPAPAGGAGEDGDSALSFIDERDILDWNQAVESLRAALAEPRRSPSRRLLDLLGPEFAERVEAYAEQLREIEPPRPLNLAQKQSFTQELNRALRQERLYDEAAWRGIEFTPEVEALLRQGPGSLRPGQVLRLNRLLLEAAFPSVLARAGGGRELSTIPHTAREVFLYIRRLPHLGWESRPWRSSTFDLGQTLFRIAERERALAQQPAEEAPAAPAAEEVPETGQEAALRHREAANEYYQKAVEVLREALARYLLSPSAPEGISREREPQDYADVLRRRFEATYSLALCQRHLGRPGQAAALFAELIDDSLYPPDTAFLREDGQPDVTLQRFRRNAYLHLGILRFEAQDYAGAMAVFERATDRLDASESPYLIYMIGECLFAQGRYAEARNRYLQSRHLAKSAPPLETLGLDGFGNEFWLSLVEERLADLKYLAASGADGTP